MRPAVFLDRDGTMIVERGYLRRLEDIDVFPYTPGAIARLRAAGFAVVVTTNQAGVARGYFDEAFVRATHARLDALLQPSGAAPEAYYYCPHHPDAALEAYRTACRCRKPSPGMIEQAAADLGLDVARSWVVGDRWLDVEMACRAGARGILVGTGEDARMAPPADVVADRVVATLGEAADHILASAG